MNGGGGRGSGDGGRGGGGGGALMQCLVMNTVAPVSHAIGQNILKKPTDDELMLNVLRCHLTY